MGETAANLYQVQSAAITTTMYVALQGRPEALTRTPQGLLVLERVGSERVLQLLIPGGTRDFPLTLSLEYYQVVPAEPGGSIFLDGEVTGGTRELLELTCRDP